MSTLEVSEAQRKQSCAKSRYSLGEREEMMVGIDVAVRFGPPDADSLIARKLFETRVVTCASPAYLKRRGVPHTPRDLAHHDCLLFRDPQTGRPFHGSFIGANR